MKLRGVLEVLANGRQDVINYVSAERGRSGQCVE